MTRRALLDDAVDQLTAAGVEGPRRSAEWIIEDATGATRAEIYARPDVVVEPAEAALVARYVTRRATGEPVQYVLGHTNFYGLHISLTPDVLIPRPETEEVVERALRHVGEAPWVLDIGTGSGAIALALKHARPAAEVFAVDVSAAALEVASGNAQHLGLEVTFVRADALRPSFADEVPPTFDLIVSNPPYVPEAEKADLQLEVGHEPDTALFVSDSDPLVFYRALAGHASRLLRPGGWVVAETHADHGQAVGALWRAAGLVEVEVHADLSGRDRIAIGRRAD
ncbi:peptide chain release factor N(5)-glutamine methyltransferase [Rubrivirga sp.]|uniref:peptide chain release factor N(5)-glutamine methyltransferase n=1 Tax=Rubrivirga sp. TaxID=1885344 RepID=UPI003C76BDD9